MDAPRSGWAEQDPIRWWQEVQATTAALCEEADFASDAVAAIGFTFQMHGLFLLDETHEALRSSVIWADSWTVDVVQEAFEALGRNWSQHTRYQ